MERRTGYPQLCGGMNDATEGSTHVPLLLIAPSQRASSLLYYLDSDQAVTQSRVLHLGRHN